MMKKYYKIFALIISVSISTLLISQTFEKHYQTNEDEVVWDACLIDSTTCIFVMDHASGYFDHKYVKIFKMDINSGNYIDSIIINTSHSEYHCYGIHDLLKISNSNIIGIGGYRVSEELGTALYIVHIDSNLNISFDTISYYNGLYANYQKSYLAKESLIVSVGRNDEAKALLVERELLGDTIRYKVYENHGYISTTIVDFNNNNNYHLFNYLDEFHSLHVINKEDLSIENSVEYNFLFNPLDAVKDVQWDSIYYTAGKIADYELPNNIAFFKIQSDGTILNQYVYPTDTVSYYTYKCLANNNDYIYFASNENFNVADFFYPEPRWIMLNKLRKDGSIVWQKFYKNDDVNYMPYKVLATPDGGALIFSTRYDWEDPYPLQRDVHILKIDSLGNYIPVGQDEPLISENQILVYPNPLKDKVHFSFGLYSNLKINIYNLQGQILFSEIFYHSTDIDMSKFPVGVYLYTITNNKGLFEKGKLIKE